jgi:hypothetical protein
MRFFVSGIPDGVGPDDVRARFESLGGVVTMDFPAPRQLGVEYIPRHFIYVEVKHVDDAKVKRFVRAVRHLCASLYSSAYTAHSAC